MSKTVKRILIVTPLVLVGLLIIGGVWMWYMMGAPLYRPGMVQAGDNLRASLDPPAQPEDEGLWRVEEDIDLYHFSHGTGRPVLFVHGGPGYPFRRLPAGLAQLTNEYEIHFYDQRGCGQSTKPFDRLESTNFYQNMIELDRTLGVGAQIADIERIRRILGRDKLILMGHSFGGFLAALYAAEFPQHVAAMILVAPADMVVLPSESGDLFEVIRNRLPSSRKEEFGHFMDEYLDFSGVFSKSEGDLAALNREFARFYMLASGTDAGAAMAELEEIANGGWMVTAIYLGLGKRHDYRDALRTVNAPVLIVHGDQDLQPEAVSQGYADLLSNASVRIVKGAGHFIFDDRPNEVAEAIRTFVAGLESE